MKAETIIGIIILIALIAGVVLLSADGDSSKKGILSQDGDYEVIPYIDIENPAGYLNSEPFLLKDLVGEKVILVDFVTYSCINCQRTFPYLNDWYSKYKDNGLEIVGIHTPEFAFEKDPENVQKAMDGFGIEFPLVLDNDYSTWRAYKNKYWPRKYLIDINGNIVYDHIGEGKYEETEKKIQELLKERMEVLGEEGELESDLTDAISDSGMPRTPEIYFGALRNNSLGNGVRNFAGVQNLTIEDLNPQPDLIYLNGEWNIEDEFATATKGDTITLLYTASKVHMVAESANGGKVKVLRDGVLQKTVDVSEPVLYTVIDDEYGSGILTLEVEAGEVDFYTFTFGS